MAFVAIKDGTGELLGVSRLVLDPDRTKGEFGILVRSALQGYGLGWHLMHALMSYGDEGVEEVAGLVHIENRLMSKWRVNSDSRRTTCRVILRFARLYGIPAPVPLNAGRPQIYEQKRAAE